MQRGKAINAWLRGVYGAGQDLVPEEIVRGSVFYRPHELSWLAPRLIHVYGPDVVHLASGEYVVLEDNVRVPSGVAYSEAIRRAGREAMPEVYERLQGVWRSTLTTTGCGRPSSSRPPRGSRSQAWPW